MTPRVFSRQFISQRGVLGDSDVVFVPIGHVYVVKFLACYMTALINTVSVFFQDNVVGNTLWYQTVNPANSDSRQLFGTMTFEAGGQFKFHVTGNLTDGADVFAAGYDLLAPIT